MDYAWILRGLRMDYAGVMNGLCMDYTWIMRRWSQMDLKMTPTSPRRAKSGPELDATLTHRDALALSGASECSDNCRSGKLPPLGAQSGS
jgi:hypothetical protein